MSTDRSPRGTSRIRTMVAVERRRAWLLFVQLTIASCAPKRLRSSPSARFFGLCSSFAIVISGRHIRRVHEEDLRPTSNTRRGQAKCIARRLTPCRTAP